MKREEGNVAASGEATAHEGEAGAAGCIHRPLRAAAELRMDEEKEEEAATDESPSLWQADLPPELLVHIVTLSGMVGECRDTLCTQRAVGATAFSCSRVCRNWRHALCRYHSGFLNSIQLRGLSERANHSAAGGGRIPKVSSAPALGAPPDFGGAPSSDAIVSGFSRVPRFVLAAASNNNPSALALAADWLQRMGDVHLAVRTWRKAARLGSVVAQIQLGKIIMDGDLDYMGVYESALQRRRRLLLHEDGNRNSAPPAAGRAPTGAADAIMGCTCGMDGIYTGGTPWQPGGPDAAHTSLERHDAELGDSIGGRQGKAVAIDDVRCLEELQDKSQAVIYLQKAIHNSNAERNDIAVAATLLGFITLDGVATSNSDAVSWFKLAAANGSDTAEETLGWLYNTGQYGDV